MDSRQKEPQRLGHRPALDGLRALAVGLVIALHVGLLAAGYIGVDVFLALSGFLITALLLQESESKGSIALARFYRRRVRRLLPALLLLITSFSLVVIVLDPFHGQWPLGRLVATTLLFINNWVTTLAPAHGSALGALSPTWTLAQEAQFYLLWPPVLWVLLRLRLGPRAILGLLALATLGLVGAGLLVEHAYAAYNAYTSPFDRGAELLLGCAAAIVWRERLVPRPLRWPLTGWILVAAIALLVASAKPSEPVWYLTAAVLGGLLIVNLLSQPGSAAATAQANKTERRDRSESRGGGGNRASRLLVEILASPPLVYGGKISYGIYLFHVPIYYLLWTYGPRTTPYVYWPSVLLLSVAAAAVSWELVESPILRGSLRLEAWRRRPALA